jgi:hypothetical protein
MCYYKFKATYATVASNDKEGKCQGIRVIKPLQEDKMQEAHSGGN